MSGGVPLAMIPGGVLNGKRAVLSLLGCAAGYVLLDWISLIQPMPPYNITPWNPQPALAIALIMFHGWRSFPLLFAAVLTGESLVGGSPITESGTWLGALMLALGFALMGALFTGRLRIGARLDARLDMIRLVGGVATMTLATGVAYLGLLAASGQGPARFDGEALLRFWVGNSVGILVTLPLVLMLTDAARRREIVAVLRRPETLAQVVAIGVALWLPFAVGGYEHFKYFYALFLPLIWVAMRAGMVGATLAMIVIQVSVVLVTAFGDREALSVFELQALLIALTMTGFFLGVTIEERERSARELRQSMRLAAAGEMAAALAHELSQPLTALLAYANASRLLVTPAGADQAKLVDTLAKLRAEARRAADVVQRLRDFFRNGEMKLRSTALPELVEGVLHSVRVRGIPADVELECRVDGEVAEALVDPVQIGIVLRNLVMNGIDALGEVESGQKRVTVGIAPDAGGSVRIEVRDTGPGMSGEQADRLGEPFLTTKASGMGMGLAISRSIIEAHGGDMWVEPGRTGAVCFTLP